jgi:hypothetical protein
LNGEEEHSMPDDTETSTKTNTRGFWYRVERIVPYTVAGLFISMLGLFVTMFIFIQNQTMTIQELKITISELESGYKDDTLFTDAGNSKGRAQGTVPQGIADLVAREQNLKTGDGTVEVSEVYCKDAEYVKKIDGKVNLSAGYEQISGQYEDSALVINEVNKFNFRVYYTKYDENLNPVEANLTYDLFIKYQYNGETRYELKEGKEYMHLVYDKPSERWLIKYFYIESA